MTEGAPKDRRQQAARRLEARLGYEFQDHELLERAQKLSGIREKTAVVHAGLEALIARESARRLAALGGTDRAAKPISRRRSQAAR